MANIIKIKDYDNKELDIYARATENELLHYYEPNGGVFIAETLMVIERALDAGYEPISMLVEERLIDTEAKDIIEKVGGIPIFTASMDILQNLVGYHLTRGVLCAMKRKDLPSVDEVLTDTRRVVILDKVLNPTNLGSIFRSAAALGMDAVLLTPECTNPLYRRAIRVSMGTVFQIPWTYITDDYSNWPDKGIEILKSHDYKTVAMALKEDSVDISYPELLGVNKLAIIMGNECYGLDNSVINASDYTVKIPMSHGVDSLNVAAASAVAFFELGKRG